VKISFYLFLSLFISSNLFKETNRKKKNEIGKKKKKRELEFKKTVMSLVRTSTSC